MVCGVRMGFFGNLGDMFFSGDLVDFDGVGERMLVEFVWWSGVILLIEWSEFVEVFFSRVGVLVLDGDLMEEELDSGLCMVLFGWCGEILEG